MRHLRQAVHPWGAGASDMLSEQESPPSVGRPCLVAADDLTSTGRLVLPLEPRVQHVDQDEWEDDQRQDAHDRRPEQPGSARGKITDKTHDFPFDAWMCRRSSELPNDPSAAETKVGRIITTSPIAGQRLASGILLTELAERNSVCGRTGPCGCYPPGRFPGVLAERRGAGPHARRHDRAGPGGPATPGAPTPATARTVARPARPPTGRSPPRRPSSGRAAPSASSRPPLPPRPLWATGLAALAPTDTQVTARPQGLFAAHVFPPYDGRGPPLA